MPGLVPGIHVLTAAIFFNRVFIIKDVDGRDEPGHDGLNWKAPILPILLAEEGPDPSHGEQRDESIIGPRFARTRWRVSNHEATGTVLYRSNWKTLLS